MDETAIPDSDWYSNDNATFGDRLADARQVLGMSQEDLARRVGVKLTTLQKWENDTAEPRANRLSMLSGILNVSLRWLLTGEGDGLSHPEDATPMTADVASILTEMRQMRGELHNTSERLGRLEKRLKAALAAGS
ncbi:helix-turn-helix domain-containing protein [Tranquillimonas alkanivorans]|uniref:Transcriptional regulator, XRE family n=1 Tax=Tranquillimonas alkanivorans TaxID=441119 RepID=A0A1I5KFR2_9RHOB|nr:helix-turn-helix transcriptional regulator [Tranquillimonas alkanivorans]SFO83882.1 transcriptional regulator, XRE family [Tranquillimonas alkanivorans]